MKRSVGLFFLLLSFFCNGMAIAQSPRLDSLLQCLPAAKADTNAVLLYIDIGEYYRNTGDMASSADYHLKAISLSRQLDYLHGLFYASDYYSFILKWQGHYDSAIAVNKEMLALAIKHANDFQIAEEKWNIGNGYLNKGFNETALSYLLESLDYFEREKDFENAGYIYYQLQAIYARMERYEDAITYSEKALARQTDTLSSSYGYILLNLAVASCNLYPPQDEKAMTCLQKTLYIASLNGNATLEALSYNCIANLHFKNHRIGESEKYYRKALSFFTEESFPTYFCIANIGLAKVAMFRNNFEVAEAKAQKNLEIAQRHGIRLEEKNALSFLWELSAAKHDYVGRNRYKAAFDSVQNLVVNESMLRAVEELNTKYETEKKETQIAQLKNERRLMVWLGLSGAALLLMALATFFFLWRLTVQKKRVAEQQKKLADQQIIQLEQEKQLIATQAVLDGEVQERTRLARDLHDGLGGMLTGMKLNLESLKEGVLPDSSEIKYFDKAMKILNDSMIEMRRIAHHLMPDTLDRFGLNFALKDFCDSFPSVEYTWSGSDDGLGDRQMEMMVYRIVYELVNNALRHSGATKIGVDVMNGDDFIALTVYDNGVGFNKTNPSEGTGLRNIRERVDSRHGRMEINSEAGKGTEINVEFGKENS